MIKVGHSNSGYNPDVLLNRGFKLFDTKNEACYAITGNSCHSAHSSKPKMSVTFHMAMMNAPLEPSQLRLCGSSFEDGASYSGIKFHETKLLLLYLTTKWNGKLNPLPKAIAGRTHWHYGSVNRTSCSGDTFVLINVTGVRFDGTNVNINNVAIEVPSQRIVW